MTTRSPVSEVLKPAWWMVACLCVSLCLSVAYAATPAGTVIKNQASASYKDSSGVVRYTTSNIVETVIQQVAALQLTQNQSRPVAAGNQVYLSHTVSNTGNSADRFNLNVVNNSSGDDFNLTGLSIYPDENQDGQPDSYTPLSLTPGIAIEGAWSFVVAATVPTSASAGDVASLTITASSQFNSQLSDTNIDTVSVSDDAVLELTKSISATSGSSPGGPFTVTLNYRNTGSSDATAVTIIDALPSGMTYVAGSGRWNQTGNVVLSDANTADTHGTGTTIRYCAYQGSCNGLAEANSDADSNSTNQVSAIISNVASGESGRISFQVTIQSGLMSDKLFNTAEIEYVSGSALSSRYDSNTVAFQVLHSTQVVVNGSVVSAVDGTDEPVLIASVAQASPVYFENIAWNTGNGTDTFELSVDSAAATFPVGTVYRLLQSDGMTPLIDSSGDGVPDTGPLAPGEFYKVVVQVLPPAVAVGDNGGAGFEVSVLAAAASDSAKTNAMINKLVNINAASIDITNVAELGNTAVLGSGIGPETTAVSTFVVTPGSEATIGLYLNNTGVTPVSLDLSVSTVSDFSTVELPENWRVSFKIDGEPDKITNTGIINPGEYLLVNASVFVAADAIDGDVSLYFRALSQVTGAVDIKHDVISVPAVAQVLLELDQDGQTESGGSFLYNHLLTNNGNVALSNMQIATADSLADSGWTSIIYEDTDGDNLLTDADQVASTISSLAVGELRRLFVKVFSPSSAANLSVNQTVLTVSWGAGVNSVAVTDITTIAELEITIVKEQAPDFGCDGTLDGPYGVGGFAVEPGNNCVSYRLTATNQGQATAFNVDVADATPAFTEYFGTAVCSYTNCTISEPSPGGQGNVVASLPTLAAGAAVILEFSIRVE